MRENLESFLSSGVDPMMEETTVSALSLEDNS